MGKQIPSHTIREEAEPTMNDTVIQEEIRRLAFELFCEGGCEHGHDLEHWAEAERRVFERYQAGSKPNG